MKKTLSFNIALVVLTGVACLTLLLLHIVAPLELLPVPSIPAAAFLIVAAMAAAYCVSGRLEGIDGVGVALAGLTVAALPLCAGLIDGIAALKLLGVGVVVSAVTWLILGELAKRLTDRPQRRLAFAASALLLALAFQGFGGMVL